MKKIIVKFLNKEANLQELETLETWLKNNENISVFNHFVKTEYVTLLHMGDYDVKKARVIINHRIKGLCRKRKTFLFKRISVAASLILLLGFSFYQRNTNKDVVETPINSNKIVVGSNKAILTLEDGSDVALEKSKVFKSNNVTSNGEEIIYNKDINKNLIKEITYNYLTIPRGGQYSVKLSDGTQVWLNSETQLKYPVAFVKGETRKVELVYGEAYFDVSPSSEHNGTAFNVYNNKQEVQVLGTEFNIKAYKDETNIYTTLVEGKVTVEYKGKRKNLIPNQQSIFNFNNSIFLVKTVDVYNEISWKEGVFSFEDKSLKEIMKVLSRWYDMDVVFKNKVIEDEEFIGILDKNQKIEEILINIKNFGIINNFEIKNKKIVLE